jgi:hypothetical protein
MPQRKNARGPGAITPQGHPGRPQAAAAKQQAEPVCTVAHGAAGAAELGAWQVTT